MSFNFCSILLYSQTEEQLFWSSQIFDIPQLLSIFCIKETLEKKNEEAIKNGQSRETGNIGYTRHKMKINKAKNTTQNVLDTSICKQTQIT